MFDYLLQYYCYYDIVQASKGSAAQATQASELAQALILTQALILANPIRVPRATAVPTTLISA